jgi:hypothetical protein
MPTGGDMPTTLQLLTTLLKLLSANTPSNTIACDSAGSADRALLIHTSKQAAAARSDCSHTSLHAGIKHTHRAVT